ncbi:MAG: glycosyltransferase family 4 protein, partial [Flavobacteriales bacterium]|nr:glycosyltransferase family 4 protein [Flavobacteriales bacterium]
MRIAYVTVHVAPEIMQGGVGRKIRTQMSIWRGLGHEVTLFSLTPAEIPFPEERQFVFDAKTNLLKRESNRASGLRRMLDSIREYKPDIIYLRFGLYSYPLHRLFKIAPTVLEVNSDDRVEYSTRGKFFYWLNRLTRGLTFGPAAGVITPTRELTRIYPMRRDQAVTVISNGVDIDSVEILPPPQNDKPVLTLVGSPGMNWHGMDKLIQFAQMNPDMYVNIVGYSAKDVSMAIPSNVTMHGYLSYTQIRDVLTKTDVVCGTLALHRKNMQEACPLKVRESVLYGVPLILAYHDTDLSDLNLPTILQI